MELWNNKIFESIVSAIHLRSRIHHDLIIASPPEGLARLPEALRLNLLFSKKLPQQSTLTASGVDSGMDSEMNSGEDSRMGPGVDSGVDSGVE